MSSSIVNEITQLPRPVMKIVLAYKCDHTLFDTLLERGDERERAYAWVWDIYANNKLISRLWIDKTAVNSGSFGAMVKQVYNNCLKFISETAVAPLELGPTLGKKLLPACDKGVSKLSAPLLFSSTLNQQDVEDAQGYLAWKENLKQQLLNIVI